MESQLELIRRKIVYLGRKYFSSPIFFPVGTNFRRKFHSNRSSVVAGFCYHADLVVYFLDYLVEHLEAMKPMEKVDQAWVVKIMFEIGIPFTDLIGIYERYLYLTI